MAKKIISILLCVVMLAGVMSFLSACNFQTVGRTYYISSSTGNDDNDAKTEGSAWKTFKNLKTTVLKEGDRVLLKRGDEWNERLEIYGGGSKEHMALVSAYGDKNAPRPRIKLNNTIDDICVLVSDVHYEKDQKNMVNEISNLIIEELDIRNAYLGIYFRTLFFTHKNLIVRNLEISEIWAEGVSSPTGGSAVTDAAIAAQPKGNLPKVNKNTGLVTETGGGANEWLLASAVLFTGGWENVEFGNLRFNNAVNGLELIVMKDVWVHDIISAGGLVFRSQHSENVKVERCRLLSTHEEFTFWGGMTGSYLGTATNNVVTNNEFSYCYRNGQNDGCGLDYETQCWDTKVEYNVFHHNDSGSLLIMELPDYGVHDNITFDHNLCYNNIRDPKTTTYNYEVLMRNHGTNNISISYNDFFTPARTKWGIVDYIGCNEDRVAASTIQVGNNEKTVDDYRTRFSFNKDGFGEGFAAHTGSFTVANGVGKITAKDKLGAIVLNNPINGFCYKKMLFNVANDAKGTLQVQYSLSDGTVKKSEKVNLNGAGGYIVNLGEDINSALYNIVVIYTPSSSNGSVEFDFIQFMIDMDATARKSGNKTIDVTFVGDSVPFVSDKATAKHISINGYTVTKMEKVNYNTVRVTVNENVGNVKNLKVTAQAGLFIDYFADIIKGLDCDRTAADDAALLGCQTQAYYYSGALAFTCK